MTTSSCMRRSSVTLGSDWRNLNSTGLLDLKINGTRKHNSGARQKKGTQKTEFRNLGAILIEDAMWVLERQMETF